MKQTNLYFYSKKNDAADAEVYSHKFLIRGNYIKQIGSGIYTYMPLGLKIIQNISDIIREELDNLGYNEILMPVLHPKTLWDETGRWEEYGENLFKVYDRHDKPYALGPTHEEVITSIVRGEVSSYKRLPFGLYQIQTKFRDEFRPRFGLMRTREFAMKDLYTFHLDSDSLKQHYNRISDAYERIFARMGLNVIRVDADNGDIGGDSSHEFMALSDIGEDTLTVCEECGYNANEEKSSLQAGENCPNCKGVISERKGIELGHIFALGTKYSIAMNAYVNDQDGKRVPLLMGCYGIGISRILMALVEQAGERLIWHEAVAPYTHHVIIGNTKDEELVEAANNLYHKLLQDGYRVLLDDRQESLGSKLKDADLIGANKKYIFGRDFKNGQIEYLEGVKDAVLIDYSKL